MKALYLEPDEEITSVVDRLKEIDDEEISIVVPKRAGLLQSIINLKLLRHQGEQLGKRISIVTTDKTGRNLASAVGLTVYQNLPEGGKVKEAAVKERPAEPVQINFRKGRRSAKSEKPAGTGPSIEDINFKSGAEPKLEKKAISEPEGESAAEPPPETTPERPKKKRMALPTFGKKETGFRKEAPPTEAKRRLSLPKVSVPKLAVPKLSVPKLTALRGRGLIVGSVAAVVLLGGGIAAAAALPSADVTVTPKTDPLNTEIPVSFSLKAQTVDPATNVVPAKVIEVSVSASKQLNTTGTKDAGAKATGPIAVVNTLSRAQPLVARTRFQAPDGRVYRTQSSVNVPAGGQATVTVVADDGGDAGNLPAGTRLTIPGLGGGSAVYGQVDAALSGGTSSATPEVSRDDLTRARQELAAEAARQGLEEARSKKAVGFELNEQMVAATVLSSDLNPPVGTASPNFTVSGQVRVVYFTYSNEDLQKVLDEDLKAKVPAGADLVQENLTQTFVTGQTSSDVLAGVMRIDTFTASALSREQLARDIAGKKPADAERLLRETGKVSGVDIKLSPFWVGSIPGSVGKIKIHYQTGAPASATPSPSAVLPTPEGTPLPSLPPSL